MGNKQEPKNEWYTIKNVEEIDSPALVIYYDRVVENIRTVVSMIDDVKRLRPHVKTHKTSEVALLMMQAGIEKFKCATIAEAEMLAMINAKDVLLAYQPFGPKLIRFISLIKKYPATKFSCLVDNVESAKSIADSAFKENLEIPVFIDLNVGMNRTGIIPGAAVIELYKKCKKLKGITPAGLHAYDGYIRIYDFYKRAKECNKAFKLVEEMQEQLLAKGFHDLVIITGGSPTFPIHAQRKEVECSPGTFIFWDASYQSLCQEQKFLTAALVITRVVSLPEPNKLCLDLGHKSIASESGLYDRVLFLNAPPLDFSGHSEEHLVVKPLANHSFSVGDVLYGLPVHICPTVALYDRATIVKDNVATGEWKIIARDRKINV